MYEQRASDKSQTTPYHHEHGAFRFTRATDAVNFLQFIITNICCLPQDTDGVSKEIIVSVFDYLRNCTLEHKCEIKVSMTNHTN